MIFGKSEENSYAIAFEKGKICVAWVSKELAERCCTGEFVEQMS